MVKVDRIDINEGLTLLDEILQREASPIRKLTCRETEHTMVLSIEHTYQAVYGMGERFNRVNQKGLTVRTEVIEQFCNQDKVSYCPIPFFFTNQNFGIFVDALTVTEFVFDEEIKITLQRDSSHRLPILYFMVGTPREIISEYVKLTGKPEIVPKWSFTPWMSANRWNTETEIYHQIDQMESSGFPHGVLVVEAWSDEATFYRFNEHGEWNDPEEMIRFLRSKGIHLVLWQIPVLKKMGHGQSHEVLAKDWEYAIEHDLCIKNSDGTPYTIPEGHWFAGSLLPDFTNRETVKWWFDKRQYLLDMGVDGFKTDGGEFVLTDQVIAANGNTGLELRNQYASSYIEAYSNFIGKDRVLFSRAGYTGQQKYPLQWAGDQMSTWEELRHILTAGISIGLSGVPFWGFDIGGFAGPMPSLKLYERATQLSVFTPVMQWHSEPAGGQFAELYPSAEGMNDRSPWNISKLYEDESLMDRLRFHYNLRMNLLPYLYNEAVVASETGLPMMKHLIVDYPQDAKVQEVEDCFMLGDLLVAPILSEEQVARSVYLPEGKWVSLWPMESEDENIVLEGGKTYQIDCGRDRIPVFIREGGCLALNLAPSLQLGSSVGNRVDGYDKLCFFPVGPSGKYHFRDDIGNDIKIIWNNGKHEMTRLSGDADALLLDKIR